MIFLVVKMWNHEYAILDISFKTITQVNLAWSDEKRSREIDLNPKYKKMHGQNFGQAVPAKS